MQELKNQSIIDEKIFKLTSKDNETLPLLTLLFNGGIQKKYEVEHMWPQSKMDTLRHIQQCDNNLSPSKMEFFKSHYDTFPNFQILDHFQNAQKSDKYYSEWVSESYPTEIALNNYQQQFAVPDDVTLYEYDKFEEFYGVRSELLKKRLLAFFKMDCPDTK